MVNLFTAAVERLSHPGMAATVRSVTGDEQQSVSILWSKIVTKHNSGFGVIIFIKNTYNMGLVLTTNTPWTTLRATCLPP